MKIIQFPVCEKCEKPITSPKMGFRIVGNIFTAKIDGDEGLIGKSLPSPDKEGKIRVADMNEIAFCNECFFNVLGYKTYKEDGENIFVSREKVDLAKLHTLHL